MNDAVASETPRGLFCYQSRKAVPLELRDNNQEGYHDQEKELDMVKKLSIYICCLAILIMTGCAPAPQAVTLTQAQTQDASPTSSYTPIPPTDTLPRTITATPNATPIKTNTPSATPGYLSLQQNLKNFLLEPADFPHDANYSSLYDLPVHIPNQEVDNTFVKDAGRVDGWSIWYGKDYGSGGWLVVLSDEISLYETPGGAQLAVKNYSLHGFFEEINPPIIGDATRAFFIMPDTNSQVDYVIIFSYRNLVHVIDEYGYEKEVAGIVKYYARILLDKLKASPLTSP